MKKLGISIASACLFFSAAMSGANAAFVATMEQVGSNVVVTGAGTLDVSALTYVTVSPFILNGVIPDSGEIVIGPNDNGVGYLFTGFSGPSSFGGGGATVSPTGTGELVGISGDLVLPGDYFPGLFLSDSMTFSNTTLAALGVTPGTYTWTWGTGVDADSFTLDIGLTATPLPAALPLFAGGLGALGLLGWRRKRKATALPA